MFRANDLWKDAEDKLGTYGAEESLENYQTSIETTFNVMFISDGAGRWNLANIRMAHLGLEMAARVFGNRLRDIGLAVDDATAFQFVFGKIKLNRSTKEHEAVAQVVGDTITIFRNGAPGESSSRNYNLLPYVLLHELGHMFNAAAGMGNKDGNSSINQTMGHPKTRGGMGAPTPSTLIGELFIASHPDLRPLYQDMGVSVDHELFDEAGLDPRQIQSLQQSLDTSPNEVTADAFLNWIVHQTSGGFEGFTNTPGGHAWQEFMNQNMDKWIRNAIVYNARDNTNAMTFFAEFGILPEVIGSGKITAEKGAYIRETPLIANNNVVTLVKRGGTLPIFGRIEVESKLPNWIATMARGDIHWVYSGVIKLPEGVNVPQ